jgi:K+-transporting ATPase ATPase A chain
MEPSAVFEVLALVVVLCGLSPTLGLMFGLFLRDRKDSPTIHRHFRFREIFETLVMRIIGANYHEMNWKGYLIAVLLFNAVGFFLLTGILMFQEVLPLNPQALPGLPLGLAVNTAVSYVTNTNWQAYSGESTLSYFSQMLGLTVQSFLSAATGIAVLMALARGIKRSETADLGNFWVDLIRAVFYVLLPLSLIWSVFFLSQGVIQNLSAPLTAFTLTGGQQTIPMGPVASQIAIKLLGSNGGGFFGLNSAHPFENPTPLSNFGGILGILLIPAALPFTYGHLVENPQHGKSLFRTMLFSFMAVLIPALICESIDHPLLKSLSLMEGKETRIGTGSSVLWAIATTATSNGSVNSMIESFSPLTGGLALFNMMLGGGVFGGVGSGVYGLVLFAILTVFIAGLMVGRSPEYLGKKIGAPEIRAASLGLVLPSASALLLTAVAVTSNSALASLSQRGPIGLTEILYGFSSSVFNNGSSFGGLFANTPFYNGGMALGMIVGRYSVIVPVLYIAGRFAAQKKVPPSSGSFRTEGWLFTILLWTVMAIMGALSFFPALTLGPICAQILLLQGRVF